KHVFISRQAAFSVLRFARLWSESPISCFSHSLSASCQRHPGPSVWACVETVVFVQVNEAGCGAEIDLPLLRTYPLRREAKLTASHFDGQSAFPILNSQAGCEPWPARPTDQTNAPRSLIKRRASPTRE